MKKVLLSAILMLSCVLVFAGGAGESEVAESSDGMITVTAARPIPNDISFPEGDDLENNVWTRLYESELGVDLVYEWMTPVAQYDQKLNISITSGDLPDMYIVNSAQLKTLADDDMLADLSGVYEEYAAPFTQDVMMQDGGNAMESATFSGKLLAIPKLDSPYGNTNVLWIRTDWLDNLGLEVPETMEDLIEVIRAFTFDDPDQNGADDTYGLAINKDLWGQFASLEGFFNGFGAYPNIWIEKDGKLVNGNTQPEMKEALQAVQKLYAEGCIDPEFGVKDGYRVSEDAGQGKVGVMYGLFWNMGWMSDAKVANPEMEWGAFSIVAKDGEEAVVQMPFSASSYYVVNYDAEHPEVLIQMLNLALEKCFGESAQPDVYNVDAQGNAIFEYPFIYSEPPMKNLDAQAKVTAALESGDTSALNAEEKGYYDQIAAYLDGDLLGWANYMNYGPSSSMAVINDYVSDGRLQSDQYFGADTEGMTRSQTILDQTQLQDFTQIIMGADISLFDDYVESWYSLGGQQITDEVNEWYSER